MFLIGFLFNIKFSIKEIFHFNLLDLLIIDEIKYLIFNVIYQF